MDTLPTPAIIAPNPYSKEYLLSHEIDFDNVLACQIDSLYQAKKAFLNTLSEHQKEVYLTFLRTSDRDCLAKSLMFRNSSSPSIPKIKKADVKLVKTLWQNCIELAHITSQAPKLIECNESRSHMTTRESLSQYLKISNQGVSSFLLAFLSSSSRSGLWKFHNYQRDLSLHKSILLQYTCKVLIFYLTESPLFASSRIVVNAPLEGSSIINYRTLQDKIEARLCYCFKVLTDVS